MLIFSVFVSAMSEIKVHAGEKSVAGQIGKGCAATISDRREGGRGRERGMDGMESSSFTAARDVILPTRHAVGGHVYVRIV